MFVRKSTHTTLKGQYDNLVTRYSMALVKQAKLRDFATECLTLLANIEPIAKKAGVAQWVREREQLCQEAKKLGVLPGEQEG